MKMKLIALMLALVLVGMLSSCGLTVPRPDIKEGRFDFSITYELNGETKTFSAVYVCEFAGTSWALEGGDYTRDWKDHVEGNYTGDNYSAIIGASEDGGDITLFFGVYPSYFMGDSTGDRGVPGPSLYITYPEDEDGGTRLVSDPTELEEVYGVKIISYEYDAPIENKFTVFDFN